MKQYTWVDKGWVKWTALARVESAARVVREPTDLHCGRGGPPLTTERERIERSHTLNPKLCEAIFTMLTLAEQPVRQHSASLYAKR